MVSCLLLLLMIVSGPNSNRLFLCLLVRNPSSEGIACMPGEIFPLLPCLDSNLKFPPNLDIFATVGCLTSDILLQLHLGRQIKLNHPVFIMKELKIESLFLQSSYLLLIITGLLSYLLLFLFRFQSAYSSDYWSYYWLPLPSHLQRISRQSDPVWPGSWPGWI